MENDIMADFKKGRFVVAPGFLLNNPLEQVVVLSDFQFWTDHFEALSHWCDQNHARIEGMTVTLPDPETLTAFCLRWA